MSLRWFLSTLPLCLGVYARICLCTIPFMQSTLWNSVGSVSLRLSCPKYLVNSCPLSVCTHLIGNLKYSMLQKYCGGMAAVLLKRFQIALSRELVYCRELEESSLFCHSHRAFEWHIFAVYLHTFPGVAHSLIWLWRVFRLLLSRFIEISQAAHNSVQRSYAARIIAF